MLRIGFALVAIQLLAVRGLLLAGGLLLLWVAWRMLKDIRAQAQESAANLAAHAAGTPPVPAKSVSFARALISIVIADVSLSLDNVLVVAGVARAHPEIMAFGLILSVLLMGAAAGVIARIIQKYPWIAIGGVLIIVFAALRMIWEDSHLLLPHLIPAMPAWLGGGNHA